MKQFTKDAIKKELSEHPQSKEQSKEVISSSEVGLDENDLAKMVDYLFHRIDADLLLNNQEFHRLVSIKQHINNYDAGKRILQAVNNHDKLVSALQRLIYTAEEMATDANIGWGNDAIKEAKELLTTIK